MWPVWPPPLPFQSKLGAFFSVSVETGTSFGNKLWSFILVLFLFLCSLKYFVHLVRLVPCLLGHRENAFVVLLCCFVFSAFSSNFSVFCWVLGNELIHIFFKKKTSYFFIDILKICFRVHSTPTGTGGQLQMVQIWLVKILVDLPGGGGHPLRMCAIFNGSH